jgi:hypothetical protein
MAETFSFSWDLVSFAWLFSLIYLIQIAQPPRATLRTIIPTNSQHHIPGFNITKISPSFQIQWMFYRFSPNSPISHPRDTISLSHLSSNFTAILFLLFTPSVSTAWPDVPTTPKNPKHDPESPSNAPRFSTPHDLQEHQPPARTYHASHVAVLFLIRPEELLVSKIRKSSHLILDQGVYYGSCQRFN